MKDMIDLFTKDEVRRARKLVATSLTPHGLICAEIVTPDVMRRIDAATGQSNDQHYMAYRLEYLATMPRD